MPRKSVQDLIDAGLADYLQVYLQHDTLREWKALRAKGATPLEIFRLGMEAYRARRGLDPVEEFLLVCMRDFRRRGEETGIWPHSDPDAVHERELARIAGKPLRGVAEPLREGRKPAGVKFRPPEDA